MKTKWKTLNEWLKEQSQKTREEVEKLVDVNLIEKLREIIIKQAEVIEYLESKVNNIDYSNDELEDDEEYDDDEDDGEAVVMAQTNLFPISQKEVKDILPK